MGRSTIATFPALTAPTLHPTALPFVPMLDLFRPARRRRHPPWPLAVLSAALLQAQAVSAQQSTVDDALPPLQLRSTPQLPEMLPQNDRRTLPSLIDGDRMAGQINFETVVEGNASLRKGDTVIHADRLRYDQSTDVAKAQGNVHVNQAGNVYEGPELQLKVESFEGFFNQVRYRFLTNGGNGQAERVDFLDEYRTVSHQATYTTCQPEDLPGWMPAWMLRANRITADTEANVGVATDAQLSFMGMNLPALPSMSFPLSSERKSGLLAPNIGVSSVNGIEIIQPYYWNIAPNRDATITTSVMSKRGVDVSSEFRYLEDTYKGQFRADYMPWDSLRDRDRWGLWTHHEQLFDASALGLTGLSGYLNINRVSDDNYWSDFARTPSLTQRLLGSEGALNWSKGDWNGQVRMLSYQTLQSADSPIVPPYNRMPQITANYSKYDWHGFDFSFNADYTRFESDPAIQNQPNAERVFGLLQLSRPFLTPGTFLIPKIQLHGAAYQFDTPLSNGASSATSVVPTFSLDSGMVFERDTTFFGRALRQTLEPRVFYVYTPYRDQSMLPVYDTAQNDFNFATIYTENAYSGHDRISDSQLATLGVTSRLIDPQTGAEAARFGIAQRLRFKDQDVTLPGQAPVTDRFSDILLGAQINWTSTWSLDSTFQYNPDTHRSERTVLGGRYSPGPYRSITVAYRYQSDTVAAGNDGDRSIDISWQWPLNDLWGDKGKDLGPGKGQGGGRWYTVGRLNYSMEDSKLTDGMIGLEYDGCCWIGRVVLQRLTTGLATANTRLLFQIEFVGLASVGTSPMSTLRQNIQRYQPLRENTPPPSRFTNYD